jgi:VIT1/CCC1 family predicted Fe2+/Mn2+ transporter
MFGKLKGKKTYVAAAVTILGAGASYLTGDATAIQAAQMAVTAVLAATLRHGFA